MSQINRAVIAFFAKQGNSLIINNPITEPIIEPLKSLFYSFKITEAMNGLRELIKANCDENKAVLFRLYLLQAEFYLLLQQLEKFKTCLETIDSEFVELVTKDSGEQYKTLKLILFSVERNEDAFNKLAKKVSIIQDRDFDYYRLLYYLNSGNMHLAKSLIDEKRLTAETANKDYALICGHTFRDLIHTENDIELHGKTMLSYYEKYISLCAGDINGFDMLNISIATCIAWVVKGGRPSTVNKHDKNNIEKAISHIEQVLVEIKHFGISYQEMLVNNLLNFYIILDYTDKFETLFSKYQQLANEDNFVVCYFGIGKEISPENVLNIYMAKNYTFFLLAYINHLCFLGKSTKLISFIEDNNLSSARVEIKYFYDLSKLFENKGMESINTEYEKVKNESSFHALIYLASAKILKQDVSRAFLEEIIGLVSEKNNLPDYLIQNFVELFFELNLQNLAFELVLKMSEQNEDFIKYIFNYCIEHKKLNLFCFEQFIDKLTDNKKSAYAFFIARVYSLFHNYYMAHKYFCLFWEKNQSIELAKTILDLIIRMKNFDMTLDDFDNFEKVSAYLTIHNALTELETALLTTYLNFERKEYEKGVTLFNSVLLSLDIDSISIESIDLIASLYFKSIMETGDRLFMDTIKDNILIEESPLDRMTFSTKVQYISYCKTFNQVLWIEKNTKKYISSNYKNISTSFQKYSFNQISNEELIYFNKYAKRHSLFHFISNKLLYKSNKVQVIRTDPSKENPFEEIFKIVREGAEYDKKIMDLYREEQVPLFFLSKRKYENYAPLMFTELLDKKDNIFYSGLNVQVAYEAKKLLTFSSLMLLKYLGLLDKVLENNNIYVQETVLNRIYAIKESLKQNKHKMSLGYSDGQYFRYEISDEHNKGLIEVYEDTYRMILALRAKKRIVKDFEYVPVVKFHQNIFEMIGYLDFYAIGYVLYHNFQLISEDSFLHNIFTDMGMVSKMSNAMSLVEQAMAFDLFIDKSYELSKLSYHCPLGLHHLSFLYRQLDLDVFSNINNYEKQVLEKFVKTMNNCGFLDELYSEYLSNKVSQSNTLRQENMKIIFDLLFESKEHDKS